MRQWLVTAFIFGVGTMCVVVAQDQLRTNGNRSSERPVPKVVPWRPKGEAETTRVAAVKPSAQDVAVKHLVDALLTGYKRGDAKAFAATFTVDGEYIDSKEAVFHGRKAMADEFTTFFRETPGTTMKIEVTSIRAIARNLMTADCTTYFRQSETTSPVAGRCRLVCTREADVWQVASLQEWDADEGVSSHHSHVSQLEWMVGDWIGEGRNSHVHFACRWDDSGNYLLRDFSIEVAGARPLSGTQRIGYDPLTQRLKMWVFDSAGGFSEGWFHRDGEKWILRTSGVTSDGHLASSANTLTQIDDHRILSETTDHYVSGQRIADGEALTIVRKPIRALDVTDQGPGPKN